jgi:hypothetical protein
MHNNPAILSIESIKLINRVAGKINTFSIVLFNNILPYFITLIISLFANISTAGSHCMRCPSVTYATNKNQIKTLLLTVLLGILLQVISIICRIKSIKNNSSIHKVSGNILVSIIAGVLTGAYAGGFCGYNGVVAMKKFVTAINKKNTKTSSKNEQCQVRIK